MTCFLCLSSFVNGAEDMAKELEKDCKVVSLAGINNYLKLGDNCLNFGDDIDSKGTEVLMCPECETLSSKLNLLCSQLVEIKLKINCSLEKFHEKLEEAKETDGMEERLVVLRESYRKTCQSKLSSVRQPVIKMEKLETMVKMEMKTELSDENSRDADDDLQWNQTWDDSEHQQLQENMEEDEDVRGEGFMEEGTSMPSLLPSKKRRVAKSPFICSTCGLQFPSLWERRQHLQIHRNPRKMDEDQANFICTNCPNHPTFKESIGLHHHNMIFHCELLFPHSKMEGITQPQYGDYCKHVLHVEGLISKLPNSEGYQCHHCKSQSQQMFLTTYHCLRKHLLRQHKNILEQKIQELQKNTRAEQLKQVVLPPVRDNRKCKDCGATFSQSDSLSRHLKQSCPFRQNTSVSASRPCKCQDCGARYGGTAAFYRHRKNKHPHSTKHPLFIQL